MYLFLFVLLIRFKNFMKKILLALFLSFGLHSTVSAQTILLQNDFTGYNGLASTMTAGWYASFHDTSLVKSFYTSSGFYGMSAPAYKFGLDSTTLISPMFSGADSLRFYMKGNGTPNSDNIFYVYTSNDSSTWNLLATYDTIAPAAAIVTLALPMNSKYLRFYYSKPTQGYNVGIDDIVVFANTTGIQSNSNSWLKDIYPNPASSKTVLTFDQVLSKIDISVYSILGNKVLQVNTGNTNRVTLDVAALPQGIYMVKVKNDKSSSSRKLVIKR